MRKYGWLAVLVTLALVALSCGSDDDTTTSGGDETTTTAPADDETTTAAPADDETTTAAPAADGECAEEITLRQFTGSVGQEFELARAAADRYQEANPCVTIDTIDTPDFVEDRLGTYLQLFEAKSPEGDVFQIDVIWPGDLA